MHVTVADDAKLSPAIRAIIKEKERIQRRNERRAKNLASQRAFAAPFAATAGGPGGPGVPLVRHFMQTVPREERGKARGGGTYRCVRRQAAKLLRVATLTRAPAR